MWVSFLERQPNLNQRVLCGSKNFTYKNYTYNGYNPYFSSKHNYLFLLLEGDYGFSHWFDGQWTGQEITESDIQNHKNLSDSIISKLGKNPQFESDNSCFDVECFYEVNWFVDSKGYAHTISIKEITPWEKFDLSVFDNNDLEIIEIEPLKKSLVKTYGLDGLLEILRSENITTIEFSN